MNQFLILPKSSHEPNASAQLSLPGSKIWVALFPGLKTPIEVALIARIAAHSSAANTIAAELQ